jgi:uncharacterized phage-associated protein
MEIYKTDIKAGAIANEFLMLANKDNIDVSNLKLMKICYIAQGLSLSILKKPAFLDSIEAWQYGPVIPSIYHEFKRFRSEPIRNYRSSELDANFELKESELNDSQLKKIVQLTWNLYGNMSAQVLVDLTHQQGTPWFATFSERENIINNVLIKQYYDKFIINLRKRA